MLLLKLIPWELWYFEDEKKKKKNEYGIYNVGEKNIFPLYIWDNS